MKAGELLVEVDLDVLKAAGADLTTMVVVANTTDYLEVKPVEAGQIRQGAHFLTCIAK